MTPTKSDTDETRHRRNENPTANENRQTSMAKPYAIATHSY